MSIKEHAGRILHAIAEFEKAPDDPNRGRHNLTGEGVRLALKEQQETELVADQINDAVEILAQHGYVSLHRALGTAPYRFRGVELTPSGRLEYEGTMASRAEDATKSSARVPHKNGRIFIGHGRASAWRELKDFVQDRLGLPWDEFNREPVAGLSTKERLQAMMDGASFAFLVMTAEDERADGTKTARANVVHEAGLFQGRLGFERAIVVLEDGCEEFSNITGITQIRFPAGRIDSVFEQVRRVLEREGLL